MCWIKNKPIKYNSPNVPPLLQAGNKILLLLIALLSAVGSGYAQNPSLKVFEDWSDTVGTQNMFRKNVVRPELGTTNVYVAGATLNTSGNYDLLVTKYNTSGAVLWTQQYNGNGNGDDYALDLQLDNSGNVYVTGTTYENTTDSLNTITIMYDASGNQQWLSTYNGNGSGNDVGAALFVDNSTGEIFVAGSEWEGSSALYDFLVLKYDNSGNQQWAANFDNVNLNDGAIRVTVNPGTGNVEAGGATQTTSTNRKYLVLELDNSSGSYINHYTSSSNTFGIDNLTDLKVDALGNVYVTGAVLNTTTGFDIRTIKLDTALNVIWSSTYAGSLDDMGNALVVDANNNVIVTGYTNTTTQGRNYVTIKYNSAGTQQWAAVFNGSANSNDSATAIAVRDTNKIYVTGYSNNGSSKDYYTIRYDAQGNEIWGIGFNSIINGDDRAFELANDTTGQIYVTGQTKVNDSTYVYNTVKYIEKSTMLPDDTISFTSSSFVFTENRGQVFGSDSAMHPEIRYYSNKGEGSIYFADTSVSFVFARVDTSASHNDSLIRVDMKYVAVNSDLRIRAMDQRSGINNFYYSHIPGGRENVHEYDKLIEFNVWNGVDVVYGSNQKGLKYYFVCKPIGGGGSSSQVHLKYEGADSVKIGVSGELIIYTRFGNIVQPKAAAWQLDASGNYTSLGWQPSYQIVAANEVKFTGLGSYNSAYPLIIAVDRGSVFPVSILNLDWSTYFGGDYREAINDVDVSQTDGSTYYTGWTWSTGSSFPATVGAYQTSNSGGIDAIAIRVDSLGQRLYSTSYGTTFTALPSTQAAYAGAVAANGNYFIGGHTNKNGTEHIGYPISQPPGAYVDTSYAGSGFTAYDAFFAGFNPTGGLIWATYYGGAGNNLDESVKDMAFDSNGNLYAVMSADTLTPRLPEAGAYNDTTLRGGMILKFDQNLALTWATMFSTKNGATNRIVFDGVGNFYVTGTAKDTLLPTVNPGGGAYFDTTLSGTSDAYIAKFNSADSLIWSTYFGGSGTENGTALEVFSGELYVVGITSSGNLPFYYPGTPYIDSTLGGSSDLFITHFKTNGQRLWTTYYGGSSTESVANIATDLLGNIYMTGSTLSSDFPFKNAPFIYGDSVFGGGAIADVILLSFDPQNQRKWASYFGGLNQDDGLGIDIYQNDKMYICGQTSTKSSMNPNFPTQNLGGLSYWQPQMGGVNEGAQYNGFISRFSLAPFINVSVYEPNTVENNSSLMVFPNPSDGEFQILINSDSDNRKIEVYNSLGQLIQSVAVADGTASQPISLNLSEEATGVYFIVLKDDNGITSKKIIKQ